MRGAFSTFRKFFWLMRMYVCFESVGFFGREEHDGVLNSSSILSRGVLVRFVEKIHNVESVLVVDNELKGRV